MTAPVEVPTTVSTAVVPARRRRGRRGPVSGQNPVEVLEDGPGLAGRLFALAVSLTVRPALSVGSHAPAVPWPFGVPDLAARMLRPAPGTVRATIKLRHCTARLIRAAGVLPADGTRTVVLYLHGGAFLTCGLNTHGRMVTSLSSYADAPVLMVDYRMIPKHSIGQAVSDCYDAYRWLRERGYRPEQIVLAGDSAGGFLALALAERVHEDGEMPAALVTMSPLFEIDDESRAAHPNRKVDAMLPPRAFDALTALASGAARRNGDTVEEPLDHVGPGLPRTLIHVSGSEVLLSDARRAASRLAAAGVPVELRVWPGQMHVFQITAPANKEAERSLRQIGRYIREATTW